MRSKKVFLLIVLTFFLLCGCSKQAQLTAPTLAVQTQTTSSEGLVRTQFRGLITASEKT